MMTAESEPVAIDAPLAAPNLAGRSILVVDDDPIQRVLLVHAFWDVDATLYQAGDGKEALSLITSQHPDLVIMDARMPKLSGPEVLAALVRADHPTKLVLTSGNTSEFGSMVANLENVVAVIEKPVHLAHLRRVVFQALDGDAWR
ncbi:MAG: response regulator [Rhodospirillaceae bacterium]|nr:response regulator [Rhodospirillaceae bacterium]MBT3932287.1 response regulator [Rhodospirillaceae bacterium]MBT4772139.1 response regulator [Rhodospirillaceae bacterium]MBT5359426.1 response regulator [Rhodospirillaceae bacterium]MBT5768381.1 response regulator [Rhodospirillaceae bacterium]